MSLLEAEACVLMWPSLPRGYIPSYGTAGLFRLRSVVCSCDPHSIRCTEFHGRERHVVGKRRHEREVGASFALSWMLPSPGKVQTAGECRNLRMVSELNPHSDLPHSLLVARQLHHGQLPMGVYHDIVARCRIWLAVH